MELIMKQMIVAGAVLFLIAGLATGGAASEVQVEEVYVRAVPPVRGNSAAFMSLTNKGGADHALVAAESSASKVVELHTHLMEEGMLKMRRVEQIDLPAGETVKLQRGALHVMLIGLTRPLSPGDDVEITLVFEDGSRASLTAPAKTIQQAVEHHR